ncbi:MAG: hypothetical protein PUP46_01455 [Endozoicomonas sp. (ex Botrylloides leachii)]|nr:hypothetical protein [Endozoicomonas sp. (ex Botrylloides leachii)]
MRKIFIFISHLFLLSFSIYCHSDPIDISKILNEIFSQNDFLNDLERHLSQDENKENCMLRFYVSLEKEFNPYYSEQYNVLEIAKICPVNKENLQDEDEAWEKYKKEIFKKCKKICPSAFVEDIEGGCISAIKGLQGQYCPIIFYKKFIEENETKPLNNDEKYQLINRLKSITQHDFVSLNVKVTDAGFLEQTKEGKLPIAILKNGHGDFFGDLETDDSRIKITYVKPKERCIKGKIDVEVKKI